jgi:hypothetical protein
MKEKTKMSSSFEMNKQDREKHQHPEKKKAHLLPIFPILSVCLIESL